MKTHTFITINFKTGAVSRTAVTEDQGREMLEEAREIRAKGDSWVCGLVRR
jgi:hypothetical protein